MMDIQGLGSYFNEFNRLAKGDGFIDEESDKEEYQSVLNKFPDSKSRDEAAQDKVIDFYEYLEATSGFSRKDIILNKEKIQDCFIENMIAAHTWDLKVLLRSYSKADENHKKRIVVKIEPLLKDGDRDVRLSACEFFIGIYKDGSEEVQKEIRNKIEPLLKDSDRHVRSRAFGFYETIYKDGSEELKKDIRNKIEPLLKDSDSGVRSRAFELHGIIYKDSSEELKKDIRNKIEPLLKDSDSGVRSMAINFYGIIYKDGSEELQKDIRNKIEPFLKDSNWDDYSMAFYFYKTIYKDSSEEVKKDIRGEIEPLLKDSSSNVQSMAINFYETIYKDSSEELKKDISNKIEPLLKDSSSDVRSMAINFYGITYKDGSEEAQKEIINKIEPLLRDSDFCVRSRAFDFYETIYKDSLEELKKDIRNKMEPLLKDSSSDVRLRACEFFIEVYKDGSEELQNDIRNKIEPLLKDSDRYVRSRAFDFYETIYKDSLEELKKDIRNKIEPLLKDSSSDVRSMAFGFYETIYKDGSGEEKDKIKKELKDFMENLQLASSREEKNLVSVVFSGKELFDEYQKTRSIAVFLLCLSPDKLKELGEELSIATKAALDILQTGKDFRIRTAVGYNLVQCLKILDETTKAGICKELLNFIQTDKTNEVSQFLRYMLSLNRQYLPQEYKPEMDKVIADILPKSPPYESLLKPGKDTIKIVVCFGKGRTDTEFYDYWRDPGSGLLGQRLKLTRDQKNEKTFESEMTIEGRKMKIVLEAHVGESWGEYGEVLKNGMIDKETDILIYAGHANSLISTMFGLEKSDVNKEAKIIMFNACTSIGYYPKIQSLNPNFQFITTRTTAATDDGIPILYAILDTIQKKGTWDSARKMLESGEGHYRQSVMGNYYLPDDEKYLLARDSDGDGIPDENDPYFDFAPSDLIVKEPESFDYREAVINQPDVFPVIEIETLLRNNHLIKHFLLEKRQLKLADITDSPFRNKGWYVPSGRDLQFTFIDETPQSGSDIPLIEARFNVGYAHCANEWLILTALADIHKYISLRYKLDEKDETKVIKKETVTPELNKDEKKREFKVIAHYLASRYVEVPEKRELLSKMWEKAKEIYDLPPIDLKTAILVVQTKDYINEPILEEKASKEDIDKVEDFFLGFK